MLLREDTHQGRRAGIEKFRPFDFTQTCLLCLRVATAKQGRQRTQRTAKHAKKILSVLCASLRHLRPFFPQLFGETNSTPIFAVYYLTSTLNHTSIMISISNLSFAYKKKPVFNGL